MQGKKSIEALARVKTRLGNGDVGNGVLADGKLTLRDDDIKYLTESMIGPKNEISDMFDEGYPGKTNYRAYDAVQTLHFYPENTDKFAGDMAGYIESAAFKLEPRDYTNDANSGEAYNPGREFVEVDPEVLQADYLFAFGVELDDNSAKRLAESFREALGESIEQWAEDREERRRR